MTGSVHIDAELLANRLRKLIDLHDQVESASATVSQVADGQTTARWSTSAAASEFAVKYSLVLTDLEATLTAVRSRMLAMHDELKASAKALQTADEQVSDLLTRLAAKLDADAARSRSNTTPTYFPTTPPTFTTPTTAAAVPTPTPSSGSYR